MTFGLVFALGMAWAPTCGVLTQTVGIRALTPGTREAGRVALRRTVLLALAFSAAAVAAHFALEDAPAIPFVLGGAAFHVGWWLGAGPLLRRDRATVVSESAGQGVGQRVGQGVGRDAGQGAARAAPSRRVASLVARDEESILPRRLWALPVAALVLSAAVVAWAAADGRITWGTRAWIVGNLWIGALLFLGGWGWWAIAAGRTRQDLSTATDPTEVDRLCREFRRFVVRALFVGTTLAVAAFAGGAAAVALWGGAADAGRIGGWLGGAGGTLIGLYGAVFGVLADRRRRAIIELGGVPPDAGVRAPRGAESPR